MALLFDADADDVNHGSDASLDNLTTGTVLSWVYPSSLPSNVVIVSKSNTVVDYTDYLTIVVRSSGDLECSYGRATTNLQARSNTAPVSANQWSFIGFHWDAGGVDGDQELFVGDLTTTVAEVGGYTTQTVGAGAHDDSAFNLWIGNWGWNPSGPGWPGDIAWIGIWNRRLSEGEMRAQQFRPHVTSGCVLFCHYGFNGTGTQPDWSGNGNAGTVTGATVSDHVPLGPAFGFGGGWMGVPAAPPPALSIAIVATNPDCLIKGVKVVG